MQNVNLLKFRLGTVTLLLGMRALAILNRITNTAPLHAPYHGSCLSAVPFNAPPINSTRFIVRLPRLGKRQGDLFVCLRLDR